LIPQLSSGRTENAKTNLGFQYNCEIRSKRTRFKRSKSQHQELSKKRLHPPQVDIVLAESLNVIWTNMLCDLKTEEAVSAIEDLKGIYDRLNIMTTREIAKRNNKDSLN
jgi:hypothetical protein